MSGQLHATIAYYDPPARPPDDARPDFTNLPLRGRPVRIEDIRGRADEFSLDREGFTVVDAPTRVRNFYDRAEVALAYVPEVGELLRAVTGCGATAMLNSPVVRLSSRAAERPAGATMTGDFVHADYNVPAAEQMLRRTLPAQEAEARLRHRYSIFNVWRAFSAPPQDVPLALCDTRSVAPQDKQQCSITLQISSGEVMTWENIAYLHSAEHRWFYCSDMRRDEAYVFRGFDSDPARAEQVPHSAFEDRTCPSSAAPRASIEIRMFAFYDE
ncbi:CmcJ/NvfI family oxidoreductase [Trebonia sp.]|uniref:CmcJ/NvfI family oxidoreductase n=1 Tax=Trebonia sp. TaxID=2767075 RepID=UPI00261CFF07|nr:CmcJ/NvfI family oxidoreductase [Trebonia sp.]